MTMLALTQPEDLRHQITEIILPSSIGYESLLLPVIAQLTQNASDRWVTWLSRQLPTTQVLKSYSIDPNYLRVIRLQDDVDNRWLIWEALAQGNSETVVAEMDLLSSQDMKAMEAAAFRGNTQGIIVRAK